MTATCWSTTCSIIRRYHDVWNAHADADAHFHSVGWHEGRDPNAFFSTAIYLSANPDVRRPASIRSSTSTRADGRKAACPRSRSTRRQYLAANPDVKAARRRSARAFPRLRRRRGTPADRADRAARRRTASTTSITCSTIPTSRRRGVDPLAAFPDRSAGRKGAIRTRCSTPTAISTNYIDVKAANVNPLDHYNQFGWKEGRDPSVGFDTTSYRAAYPDVAAANVNPLTHFLERNPRRPLAVRRRRVGLILTSPSLPDRPSRARSRPCRRRTAGSVARPTRPLAGAAARDAQRAGPRCAAPR